MAEAIGIASGVVGLAGGAFKASIKLCDLIKGFKHHPRNVRELISETEDLSRVLRWLSEMATTSNIDLSVVEHPLKKCGEACDGFQKQLQEFLSNAGETQLTFRGWIKFQYKGDDLESFRQMLATHKSLITMALTGANLRTASVTAETVHNFKDNIKMTTDDLEERLESLNDKFESILQQAMPESELDAIELRAIEEERLSTHKCLQICAKLSAYLEQTQILPTQKSRSSSSERSSEAVPERIMNEGLQEWQESLRNTTQKLNNHMRYLVSRLVSKSKTKLSSEEDIAELTRLQEEIETNRQFLDICFQAEKQAKEKVSQIDNDATGDDNTQLLVSTDGKIITGKNKLRGSRTQQFGGHIDGLTLQKILQPNSRITGQIEGDNALSPQDEAPSDADDVAKDPSKPGFQGRYGTGYKLPFTSLSDITSKEQSDQNNAPGQLRD